jgi:hypothetical protein
MAKDTLPAEIYISMLMTIREIRAWKCKWNLEYCKKEIMVLVYSFVAVIFKSVDAHAVNRNTNCNITAGWKVHEASLLIGGPAGEGGLRAPFDGRVDVFFK